MFLDPQSVIDHFNINQGMKVADFGSGHGHFAVPIAREVGLYGRVYAIDIIPEALDHLRSEAHGEGISHINFIHGNLEKERGSLLSDKSVDRVLLINTLFAIDDKPAILNEALRILKPKGHFILIDWKDSFRSMGPQPNDIVPLDVALDMATNAGFEFKKDFEAGDMHYGLLFDKINTWPN